MANMLWLVEAGYPEPDPTQPGLAVSLWAQYLLDQFATVEECVEHLRGEPFVLMTDVIPGTERMTTVHLSISDRNVSVPFGINTEEEPNISSTRWRVLADHKDLRYYFESAVSPNIFWVDLAEIDFSEAAGSRKLDLGPDSGRVLAGEASGAFVPTPPFVFHGL